MEIHFSIEAFQIERQEPGGSFVLTNSSEEYTVDQEPWYIDRSANHRAVYEPLTNKMSEAIGQF